MSTSLRETGGHVCLVNERVIRIVDREGLRHLRAFLSSEVSTRLFQSQKLVNTKFLNDNATAQLLEHSEIRKIYERSPGARLIEHERVEFPSFPHEWPAEMLHAAGILTLELAEQLLDEGLGLKDVSPYNILFQGPDPVFINLLSFETRDTADSTWLPLTQFVRTFLLPLLVHKEFGISISQLLNTHRDGVEPEEIFDLLNPVQRFLPRFLSLVSLPVWLASGEHKQGSNNHQKRNLSNPTKAKIALRDLLRNTRRKLSQVAPRENHSPSLSKDKYSTAHLLLKQAFVTEVMREFQPGRVLDVGCNTGYFSAIAARNGAGVVAIDSDAFAAGQVWLKANAENLDILPLVVDLARPTPGIGWRNAECSSFLDRARGSFEAVFLLDAIHHLLVTERIPLHEIMSLAADLTNDVLIIEYVAPDDPVFQKLTRGCEHLFSSLNRRVFEEVSRKHFDLIKAERLDETNRWLYLMRKRGALIECYELQQ